MLTQGAKKLMEYSLARLDEQLGLQKRGRVAAPEAAPLASLSRLAALADRKCMRGLLSEEEEASPEAAEAASKARARDGPWKGGGILGICRDIFWDRRASK